MSEPPPTPLYHYTSLEALYGIVTSKEIWCSNILYLNDRSELKYALDQCQKEAIRKREELNGVLVDLWDEVIDILVELHLEMTDYDIYVASFSEVEDDLGQWRAYCNDGPGVCIGFSPAALSPGVHHQGFDFCQCIYDPSEQTQKWRAILARVLETCEEALRLTHNDIGASRQIVTTQHIRSFLRWALQMKHSAFSAEREWRLASLSTGHHGSVKFRLGRGLMVPYLPLKLAEDGPVPISSVTLSPGGESTKLNYSAIGRFLKAQGIDAAVQPSGVPYRGQ
jgi:hypothetical protein